MPIIDEKGRVKIDSRYLKACFINSEHYKELELIQEDDFTYKLYWRRNITCDHNHMIDSKCEYDGEYLTLPESIRECYGKAVFIYTKSFAIHIHFMQSVYESPKMLSEEELEKYERSFIVEDNLKNLDKTWEEFFLSLPRNVSKAIFYSQKARKVK